MQRFSRIKTGERIYYYKIAILKSPLSLFTYESKEEIEEGTIVTILLKKREVKGLVYSQCEKPSFLCENIKYISSFYLPKDYFPIIKFISDYYICSLGEAANLFVPFKKGQKEIIPKEIDTKTTLSPEQIKAFEFLKNKNLSLLFGDTGSGKTEIYIKLFEQMIREGKSSVFLLPEIALTPQMQKRLEEKFGDLVIIWHSKITKKRREKLLERIYNGEVMIVAGPRSALFLPLKNPGLIVVDEEHDESYKAGQRPRYNAKDLAIYTGKRFNIKVVLGSATPSLGSYVKYPVFRLRGGFYQSGKSFVFEHSESKISPLIIQEIKKCIKSGSQAIIFLPTRANFKYLVCKKCSQNIECPYCSVGMSLHFDKNILKCHYCGYAKRIPKICPSCGSSELISQRIGTAEVVEELSQKFGDFKIMKFDRDEITTDRKLRNMLKDFNDKKIDVLVGTQMLSKGHDYHDISLAVILGIDNVLSTPDFKAREKAMSLLLQIAGRTGRKNEGKVIVQTLNESFFGNYIKDYELFLKDEINFRKNLYPPFVRLLRIIVSHKKEKKALETAQKAVECINRFKSKEVELIGFAEAAIYKISSKYRYSILLRSKSPKALIETAMRCKCSICEIDMDALSFS